jgi:hypothetical protein
MGFYVIANALTRLLPHGLHYTIDRLQPSAPQQKGRGYRNINIFIPLRGAITTKGVYASCVWRIKLRWEVNESLLYKINFQQPLMRISLWGVTHLSNVIYQSTPFCQWGKKIINAKQPIYVYYSSFSTSATRRVTLDKNQVIYHECRKGEIVTTTTKAYPWSCLTHIFRNG